jgi:hypothetical protein
MVKGEFMPIEIIPQPEVSISRNTQDLRFTYQLNLATMADKLPTTINPTDLQGLLNRINGTGFFEQTVAQGKVIYAVTTFKGDHDNFTPDVIMKTLQDIKRSYPSILNIQTIVAKYTTRS